jgi:hypothetical protein
VRLNHVAASATRTLIHNGKSGGNGPRCAVFYFISLIPESSQQPYQLRTPKTLSLSYPRMSQRKDGDVRVWPISRPYSPSAVSPSGDFPTAKAALPSVHLPETIHSSKRQCTETSHAGAWIEETRREGYYRNARELYGDPYLTDWTDFEEEASRQHSQSMDLLLPKFTYSFAWIIPAYPCVCDSCLYTGYFERRARATLHAISYGNNSSEDSMSFYRPCHCFDVLRGSIFPDPYARIFGMRPQLLLNSSFDFDVIPEFWQEKQRTMLWRRCAINDLAWSSSQDYVPDVFASVPQDSSLWRRRTPPKLH